MGKNSGFMVEVIADGRTGRTYHNKPPINGKVVVYLEKKPMSFDFEDKGTLFAPDKIRKTGFID